MKGYMESKEVVDYKTARKYLSQCERCMEYVNETGTIGLVRAKVEQNLELAKQLERLFWQAA